MEVRRRVLEAVAPLSLPKVRRSIAEAYQSGNSKLKISALYAMGKNCDPCWLPILIKELTSADAEVRYEATGACGELGEDEAVVHLIELTDDIDADVQLAAVQALGKIGGIEAKKHLQKCLNHLSEAICQVAAQALHELEVTKEPLSPHDLSYGELND
jgi:HEAT repeat protein